MAGLDLSLFRVAPPGPTERQRPDYSWLDNLGTAIARGRHESTAEDQRQQELDRATQRDATNDSRERVGQEQRAREMLMSDKRAGQREDLYARQEDRRNGAALREEDAKKQAEVEELFRGFQQATINRDPAAIHYYKDALERHGIDSEEIAHAPPPAASPLSPTAAAPVAPARPPLPGQRAHLSKPAAANLSRELSQINTTQASGGKPTVYPTMPDAEPIDQPTVQAPRYLPGQEVLRSSQFLSPDDPYNNIK